AADRALGLVRPALLAARGVDGVERAVGAAHVHGAGAALARLGAQLDLGEVERARHHAAVDGAAPQHLAVAAPERVEPAAARADEHALAARHGGGELLRLVLDEALVGELAPPAHPQHLRARVDEDDARGGLRAFERAARPG